MAGGGRGGVHSLHEMLLAGGGGLEGVGVADAERGEVDGFVEGKVMATWRGRGVAQMHKLYCLATEVGIACMYVCAIHVHTCMHMP